VVQQIYDILPIRTNVLPESAKKKIFPISANTGAAKENPACAEPLAKAEAEVALWRALFSAAPTWYGYRRRS
jgi:hypothetical protein